MENNLTPQGLSSIMKKEKEYVKMEYAMKRKLALFLGIWIWASCILCSCNFSGNAYEETQFLMDTVCTMRAGGSEDDKEAVQAAFKEIQKIQAATDFYREDSTVGRFNRASAGTTVMLDEDTAEILATALEVGEASRGAFAVTIAPVQQLWPFHGEEDPKCPTKEGLVEALQLVDQGLIQFDYKEKTLTKTKDGVAIDLGGAAKGYAADRAVAILKEKGVDYALLDLGGNIYVFGKNPSRKDGTWTIGIQTPFATGGEYEKTVTLNEGAVVTSGTYQRFVTIEGKEYHHILDPATGYPAEKGLTGVTIVAPSALLADCLSTACLVLGEEEGKLLAENYQTQIYFTKENTKERKTDE